MLRTILSKCMVVLFVFTVCSGAFAADLQKRKPLRQGVIVLSVVPSRAAAGESVVITGSGITPGVQIKLGDLDVPFRQINQRQIEFQIPAETPPGLYALVIQEPDGTRRSLAYTVLSGRPVITGITPERIAVCSSGSGRNVTVRGRNFAAATQLLFDGAIIGSQTVSSDEIVFVLPTVAGGLHQVAVRNGSLVSVPFGLQVADGPEINNISVGNNMVNSYELIIDGYNFTPATQVVVNGAVVGGSVTQTERVIFHDCTRLVYRRQPVLSTPSELRINLLNPGGQSSSVQVISAP